MSTDNKKLRDFDPDAEPTSEKTITIAHVNEPHDVYGGRATGGKSMEDRQPPHKGWLGNPFLVAEDGRETCIRKFRDAFLVKLRDDRQFCNAVLSLQGQVVACHCREQGEDEPACHLDVVRRFLLDGLVHRIAHDTHGIPLTDYGKERMATQEAVLEVSG